MKRYIFLALVAIGAIVLTFIYLNWGNPGGYIITQVRLPRLLLTVLTGMSLAAIGSVYQLMLGNPLAEPYILGISSGSAFGSILFAVLGMILLMPLGGFIGAILTMLLVWRLAQRRSGFDPRRLIIAGVIVGMFFSSGISLMMYLNRQDTVLILGTLMGNLGRIFNRTEYIVFLSLAGFIVLLLAWLFMKSRALDILSSSDLYAASVGIEVERLRKQIFFVTSLVVGIVVSYAGIIGFVGLITPHIMRLVGFRNQKKIFPASLLFGAAFLLGADFLAKNLSVIELPVGVITAAIGCPFFIYLLLRK
ncbi:MAG: iron ABC transporter permease [Candidatus Cloacimonetes bacterium]|jgi:iron complex transport system permease protein|nr:iron ABC transporter permease [Candidatus Cloacimonadota bacterium]MDD2506775.1 iron ABC transporter permease [Candidatus Cloacimonadota bacterium]MDD4148235.1 iron ABC transporter permease [Candidatus Cloacimonadota bacterium]MDD4560249.1 iron ABC transporter permease [Candidatus Cloacimonadota bacterium]